MAGLVDQARLVDALRDLMALYYVPNEPAEIRARQIALFVKDLGDLSDDCVFWAVDEWRRTQDRRPSIASLRQLAMQRRAEAFSAAERRRKHEPEPEFVAEPDPAKRKENLDRINEACGMIRHKGQWVMPAFVAAEQERAVSARHWSETAAPDDPRIVALREARKSYAVKPNGGDNA